jgi:hypothetical protein
MSLPGLTGQSSTPGRCLLDCPVEPGDDSEVGVDPGENAPPSARDAPCGSAVEAMAKLVPRLCRPC